MANAIDRLITADPGGRQSQQLYAAARNGGQPLSTAVATQLTATSLQGESVLVTTGFPIYQSADGQPQPETDGPLGAVVVAAALARVGAEPVVVVEEFVQPVVASVAAAAGVSLTIESLSPTADSAAAVVDRTDPAAVIAIERPGRSSDGTYRNMAGEPIGAAVGPIESVFQDATEAVRVAVGDGGNELGMGGIQSAVETHVPNGERIAATTPADALVVAGVSNWGAYGLVAALSVATDQQLLHTEATEAAMLRAAVEAGAVDGVTGAATESVDSIPRDRHTQLVSTLAETVTSLLSS